MGRHKRLDNQRALAYEMYAAGYSLPAISERLDISIDTLKNWAYRGSVTEPPWKDRRQEAYANRLVEVLENDFASLDEIFGFGLNTIKRSLAQMELDRVILTQDGISKLVGVLDKLQTWTEAKAELNSLLELQVEEDDLKETLEQHPFFSEGGNA